MLDYFNERQDEHGIKVLTADIEESDFVKQHSEFYKLDVSKKTDFDQLPKDIYAIIDLATLPRILNWHKLIPFTRA